MNGAKRRWLLHFLQIGGILYMSKILNYMMLNYMDCLRSNKRTLKLSFVRGKPCFYKGRSKLGFNCQLKGMVAISSQKNMKNWERSKWQSVHFLLHGAQNCSLNWHSCHKLICLHRKLSPVWGGRKIAMSCQW